MTRKLTDAELLQAADAPDWWTPSWAKPAAMMSLRVALSEASARPDCESVSLFRAGGFGAPTIWLKGEDITRLHALVQNAATAPDKQSRRARG